jgi:TamB, inner membrane protein subunit of TAM complex
MLIQLKSVQTYAAHQASIFLAKKLNTKVEIGSVEISFFRKIILNDIYIEDLHHDTLLYSKRLKVGIEKINLDQHQLYISDIVSLNTTAKLQKYSADEDLNLQFLIDAFDTGPSTKKKKKVDWDIRLGEVTLVNTNFTYRSEHDTLETTGVNYFDLHTSKVNGRITDIQIDHDTIHATIDYLSAVEKSGFILQNFSSYVKLSSTGLKLDELRIKTPESEIATDLYFSYKNYRAYNDFIDSVKINAVFDHSQVELNDISYFAPELKGIYRNITVSGKVTGKISDLKGKNMELQIAEHTAFAGDFTLTGLPKIDETVIYLNVTRLTTNYTDLKQIPIPPFLEHKTLSIPANIAKLGNMKFKGTFTGLYNDFYAYGDFSSALGGLSSDLSVRHDDKKDKEFYKGKLKSTAFDFGNFFGVSQLGKASINVDIDGSGLTLEEVAAQLNGTITSVDFNNYTYKNIAIEGTVAKQIFKGKLNVKDDNIDFDFIGDVDFTGKLPKLDFITTLNKADLAALHFMNTTKKIDLSTQLIINVTGNNIDNLRGQVNFDNTIYKVGNETYKMSVFNLESLETNGLKTLVLNSDFADAKITGMFTLLEMPGEVEDILHQYLPSFFKNTDEKNLVHENFEYTIKFKKTEDVTRLFLPGISIAPKTLLSGSFTSTNDQLKLSGSSPQLNLYGYVIKNWSMAGETKNNELSLITACDKLFITDSLSLTDLSVTTTTRLDSINLGIKWDNKATKELYKGDVKTFLYFGANKVIEFKILPSEFIVSDSAWAINKENQTIIDSSYINIHNLTFQHNDQSISLNGIVSEDKKEQMKLNLNQFDLSNLNLFTSSLGLNFKGTINGESIITDAYKEMVITNDLDFKSFYINNNEIGNGDVESIWDKTKEALYLHGSFAKAEIPNILFSGYYYPKRVENNMDMEFNIQAIQMELFKPFVKQYCSDFSGLLSGSVTMKGTLKKPEFAGKMNIDAKKITVDYLNTSYKFNQEVIIDNNSFGVDNMTLYDMPNNNKAVVTGKVYHTNFKDFQLDFDIKATKFMCLNTTEINNNLYYGTAFVTGIVNIFGFTNNIRIDANVKTEKITSTNKADKINILSKTELTKFFIPLSGTSEVSQNNFITFVKKDTSATNKYNVELDGITLNFDVDVTPDAEIQLIFDQKVGDVIKARGNGNIKLQISPQGEFSMYGDYVIDDGDYLFTLQNVINKRFDVENGSTIKWSGIPYKADLNLNAIYKARASLKPVVDTSTTSSIDLKKRYPVDLKLNMTGDLLSPVINFDIDLPTVDATTRQTVLSTINNEAEVNRQVFSLLILNSFVTPSQSSNNGTSPNVVNAAGANTSEMISNQLSNMLSKISNDFDIGVNYRPGDAISKDELAVALSTQLFNDKLSIEGNVGNNPNSQAANTIVGDVNIDYKLTDDGKVRIKAFNKTNDNNQTNSNGAYTQGVGIFYREDFNTISELYQQYLTTLQGWTKNRKKKQAEADGNVNP